MTYNTFAKTASRNNPQRKAHLTVGVQNAAAEVIADAISRGLLNPEDRTDLALSSVGAVLDQATDTRFETIEDAFIGLRLLGGPAGVGTITPVMVTALALAEGHEATIVGRNGDVTVNGSPIECKTSMRSSISANRKSHNVTFGYYQLQKGAPEKIIVTTMSAPVDEHSDPVVKMLSLTREEVAAIRLQSNARKYGSFGLSLQFGADGFPSARDPFRRRVLVEGLDRAEKQGILGSLMN